LGTSSKPPRRRGAFGRALEGVVPAARFGDERTILAGTGQNVLGLVVAMAATFGTQVLITRVLGAAPFGVVTLATQGAFVVAAATRFGMDMASVRRVAIEVGQGRRDRVRAIVRRAAVICLVVSLAVAAAAFAFADRLGEAFTTIPDVGRQAFRAAALALPFAALAQVHLGATRGLKIMRHTLYVFWMGQPLAWVVLILAGWLVARTVGVTVLAYAASWALASGAAAWVWHRETRGFGVAAPAPGEVRQLLRYGAPRAPAALFSQVLFWADLFVLARFATSEEVGIYSAAVRAAQVLLLFIIAVNYMFSPFVADLHARGERDRLDDLYKKLTRWTLAATIPVLVVLAATPGSVLRLFGGEFGEGSTALLILLGGQIVNVGTGSVGFILIMVGRTGWDLAVYAGSVIFDVAVAVLLIAGLGMGMEGAATAGAVTLALSNGTRLLLVWRFLGIQPFTRHYARLAIPGGAALAAALGVHALLVGAPWYADLAGTAAAAGVVYAVVLFAAGLPPAERRAAARLVAALRGRD
jgi:O-antigen/teichoic acid export membrane protein